MQKMETDKLYIIGLFMLTDNRSDDLISSSRFLKWIVVENQSDDYSTSFKDIRTGVTYFASGFEVGDLFIDMNTIVSMNKFTHKGKITKEEINYYLKSYKENDKLEQIRDKRIILEVMKKSFKSIGPDKAMKIIGDVMDEYDESCPKNVKEFINEVSIALELESKFNKRKSNRYKKKGK